MSKNYVVECVWIDEKTRETETESYVGVACDNLSIKHIALFEHSRLKHMPWSYKRKDRYETTIKYEGKVYPLILKGVLCINSVTGEQLPKKSLEELINLKKSCMEKNI